MPLKREHAAFRYFKMLDCHEQISDNNVTLASKQVMMELYFFFYLCSSVGITTVQTFYKRCPLLIICVRQQRESGCFLHCLSDYQVDCGTTAALLAVVD